MLFEEVVLSTFLLTKMEKYKTWKEADKVLIKLSIGRRTGRDKIQTEDQLPYRIGKVIKKSEKYLEQNIPDLKGSFNKMYTFISDFVHPNAPSRYYFWEYTELTVKFIYRRVVATEDLIMILNYTALILGLYKIFWSKLQKISLE